MAGNESEEKRKEKYRLTMFSWAVCQRQDGAMYQIANVVNKCEIVKI